MVDHLEVRIPGSLRLWSTPLAVALLAAGCAADGESPPVSDPTIGGSPVSDATIGGSGPVATLIAVCASALPEGQVFEQDAQAYADAVGVSLDEATRRLALQNLEGLQEAARAAAPDLWAAAWLEHEPEFGHVLFYKGNPADVEHVRAATEDCVAPIIVRSGAEYSEAELLTGMERLSESGRLAPPMPALSMYPDVAAGEIVLGGPIDPGPEVLAEIEEIAGVPVRYVEQGRYETL